MRLLPPPQFLRRHSRHLKNLPHRHRHRALADARLALSDYLHLTRSLPFTLADHIASHSPAALAAFVSQIPFLDSPPAAFPRLLRSSLAYRPVNEFDFFFESLGLAPSVPRHPSPFLADDARLLPAVSCLTRFGFPWALIGSLYANSPGVFSSPAGEIAGRLRRAEGLGFSRVCVMGIWLVFPEVVCAAEGEGDVEMGRLLRELKVVFVDYGLGSCGGDDVELVMRFCRGIRGFYDVCGGVVGLGELMGRERRVFVEVEGGVIARRLRFFRELGMGMEEVGGFALRNSGVFYLGLDDVEILIPDYLMRVGLGEEESELVAKRFPYVMGRNKLGNLPGILRALKLDRSFCDRFLDENNLHFLSSSYACVDDSCDNGLEAEFMEDLERIKLVKQHQFIEVKVEFFLSVGFGKNKMMSKAIGLVSGNKELLQERFDCLIGMGIKYDMLCRMINATPKLLNQCENMLRQKVNYLCQDLGYPIEYLDKFPAFLCFDLENRIKARYRILNWLRDNGLVKKSLSPATVLANSERRFIFNLSCIHPAAPKQWFECFSAHNGRNAGEETS